MRNLPYESDMLDYLVNLRDLNQVIQSAGQAYRDQVEAQLPDDIVNMMYMLGPIPETEDEFLQVAELVGKRVEQMKRRAKGRSKGEVKLIKNNVKKEKQKEKEKEKNKNKDKIKDEYIKKDKNEGKDKKLKRKQIRLDTRSAIRNK
jgi:hypothetical protein